MTPDSSALFAAEAVAVRQLLERLLTVELDLREANITRDERLCLGEYLADKCAGYLDC